jgi:hypothetical protein
MLMCQLVCTPDVGKLFYHMPQANIVYTNLIWRVPKLSFVLYKYNIYSYDFGSQSEQLTLVFLSYATGLYIKLNYMEATKVTCNACCQSYHLQCINITYILMTLAAGLHT